MVIANDELQSTARHFKTALIESMFGVSAVAAEDRPLPLAQIIPEGSNILGVGYGAKSTAGSGVDELAVRVYVRAKEPPSVLRKSEIIPSTIEGTPTDVIAVGDLAATGRPTQCGVSVGHV
jgi:hypothetical protein